MKLIARLLLLLLFGAARPAGAWPTVFSPGVTLYNPERAANGYTLFAPVGARADGTSTVYLINMNGEVVHHWDTRLFVLHARLLPNGNLLVLAQNQTRQTGRPGMGQFWIGGAAGTLVELGWEGKTVATITDLHMHHDALKLPGGNYLYLAWERVPPALLRQVRGGLKGTEFSGGIMWNDVVVEADPRGRRVWSWSANRHLDPRVDIVGPLYRREEWAHINALATLSNGDLLLTSRSLDSLVVVSRRTGRVLRRLGGAAYVDAATGRPELRTGPERLGGPHGGEQIAPGLPGAGHFLAYDNGLYNFASRAVEMDAAGRVRWQSAQPGMARKHFSDIMGNAQRLPNGNTLICDGGNGRIFEETREHGVVWEYQNPYATEGLLQGGLLRAIRYFPGYCPQLSRLPPAPGPAVVPNQERVAQTKPTDQPHRGVPVPLALGMAVVTFGAGVLMTRRRGDKTHDLEARSG